MTAPKSPDPRHSPIGLTSCSRRWKILPLETPVDRHYGAVRQQLARQGTPIGPNDLLITAQALALDLTVVTANVQEFSRVPGLGVENWLSE